MREPEWVRALRAVCARIPDPLIDVIRERQRQMNKPKFTIEKTQIGNRIAYVIRKCGEAEMVCWCEDRAEAEKYIKGTLAGQLCKAA